MNKKFILAVVIIIIILAGAMAYWMLRSAQVPGPSQTDTPGPIETYSMNATITQINGENLEVSVTSESGNQTKTIVLADNTFFYRNDFQSAGLRSDLKPGQQLIIYSHSDPSASGMVNADKIIIQNFQAE